jgi:hypothetical protein
MTYRILLTGSRTWTYFDPIADALYTAVKATTEREIVLVHGAARGADQIAADYAARANFPKRLGKTLTVEAHPADWNRYGVKAGIIRNEEMVALGADVCLAFIDICRKPDCPDRHSEFVHGSHGAVHCADLAEKTGIPTKRFRP